MPRYAQLVVGPAGSGKVSLEELRCVGGWATGETLDKWLPALCLFLAFLFGNDSSFNSS